MTTDLLSQMYPKIDGRAAPAEMMRDLKELVVDTSLHMPDMFTIFLDDPDLNWIDSPLLDIGKRVEISGRAAGQRETTSLIINGEITAIEPELTEGYACTIVIRGYDKTHRLHRGKKTRAFVQKKDSDIVSEIAGKYGLTPKVDNTSVVHDHIIQDYQTGARAYDIYSYWSDLTADLAASGALLNMDEYIDKYKPDWNDPVWGNVGGDVTTTATSKYLGSVYNVVMDGDYQLWVYRKDLFEDPKEQRAFKNRYGWTCSGQRPGSSSTRSPSSFTDRMKG